MLKDLDLPWTISALQLGIGLVLWVAPLWLTGLRKMPSISMTNVKTILPIAVIHGLGQCVTVMSLGAGSIAFVNVVKSLEPLFNVVFMAIIMGDMLPWQVNACLLPVVGGVGYAASAEAEFSFDCFAFAMGSNIAFSLRGVLTKSQSKVDKGANMSDPGNNFAVMSALAFLAVVPIAIAIEGPMLMATWDQAVTVTCTEAKKPLLGIFGSAEPAVCTGVESSDLLMRLLLSGLSFHVYNEIAMYTLDKVNPITHAVGNTIKRVILILYSVVRFGTAMNFHKATGSAVAIGGVFAYSIAKVLMEPKKTEAAKK